jgi:hypothetical protein
VPQSDLEKGESFTYLARVYNTTNDKIFAEIERTDPLLNQIVPPDQIISENNTTVNGKKATETVFNYSKTGTQKVRMVIIDEPTKRYVFTFYAPKEDYDAQQPNFDMILNSFQGI